MTEKSIRIMLVDDHPIVRSGLVLMIDYTPNMEVVAEANNGLEAIELFRQHSPDVTLMDLRMPEISGVEAIAAIHQEFPESRIIVLTTYDGDEDIYRGLKAGARGYIFKNAPVDEIVSAIRKVHGGMKYIPPEVGEKLSERLNRPQLSNREVEVLQLIAKGMSNQEIASALYLSESTIKYHVNSILSKLAVSDRTQAALIAVKRGIINH
ncbi:response regulator containing a CheY-like receiver domain and an HTH DNA-binding domain [Synechococcus sp. PCC 7502]|uniref:response regulator n=1 Tax=Synechococcus sp. PCC 7502 TaxID=1173263 RepID=UPI00029F9AF8|nr:response regulator transcription factor [Synechococcus sp. PCC 7502]AFY75076.1 response regulator containing a CheY-like receiver domain and an HTH DNA-binding domain [Synechococcus sp. PCC 7502]